jgi:hypothetical protein
MPTSFITGSEAHHLAHFSLQDQKKKTGPEARRPHRYQLLLAGERMARHLVRGTHSESDGDLE